MEKVPVNKCKTVFDDVQKQTWVDQEKTVCEKRTTMVTKEIPVYTWKQNEPGPCQGPDCGPPPQPPPQTYSERVKTTYTAPASYDANNDGVLDESERAIARADGVLKVNKEVVGESLRASQNS